MAIFLLDLASRPSDRVERISGCRGRINLKLGKVIFSPAWHRYKIAQSRVRASIGSRKKGNLLSMSDNQIDFSAPATLRKWPSVNNERVRASEGARPYLIIDGTLEECIGKFMSQPESQHHLYEIHTAPQSGLAGAVLSADHVVELARLRDFLGK
jgi:hypothetical protein